MSAACGVLMSLRSAAGQRLTVVALTGSGGGRDFPHEGRRKPRICQEIIAGPRGARLGLLVLSRSLRVARQAADGVLGPAAVSPRSRCRRHGRRRRSVAAGALRWKPRDFISGLSCFAGRLAPLAALCPCSSARQGGDAKDIKKIAGTTMKAMALSTLDLPR